MLLWFSAHINLSHHREHAWLRAELEREQVRQLKLLQRLQEIAPRDLTDEERARLAA
jgi:hypothetical protein